MSEHPKTSMMLVTEGFRLGKLMITKASMDALKASKNIASGMTA
jgi:hypothetical protein